MTSQTVYRGPIMLLGHSALISSNSFKK